MRHSRYIAHRDVTKTKQFLVLSRFLALPSSARAVPTCPVPVDTSYHGRIDALECRQAPRAISQGRSLCRTRLFDAMLRFCSFPSSTTAITGLSSNQLPSWFQRRLELSSSIFQLKLTSSVVWVDGRRASPCTRRITFSCICLVCLVLLQHNYFNTVLDADNCSQSFAGFALSFRIIYTALI